jgi:polyhydroxybutyrate depolymerase
VKSPRALLALVVACCLIGCGTRDALASAHSPPGSHSDHSATSKPGTGGLKTVHVMSGGHLRTYLLYVPPGDSTTHRLALVLVYHGALDTAIETTTETNLLTIAKQRHNMILAFMQGYDDTWNEGAGHTPAHQAGINDVAFTATVLSRIESNYDVDLRRVAATGLSNGALLTELLGCRLAADLTLIAPVEGQLPVSVSSDCRPSTPISVFEVHGTDDQSIPYGGGPFVGVGGGTTVLSAPASAARWAGLDRCAGDGQQSQTGNDVLTTYTGCREGVTVTLDSVQGGQHDWPDNFGQTLVDVLASLKSRRPALRP